MDSGQDSVIAHESRFTTLMHRSIGSFPESY